MKKHTWYIIGLAMTGALIITAMILAAQWDANAEALPSPSAPDLLRISGDLTFTGAPVDLRVAECIRVDVAGVSGGEEALAELTVPYIPPSIRYVGLFDGYHLILAKWEQADETTLRMSFRAKDLEKLDGTVGVYLVIIARRDSE